MTWQEVEAELLRIADVLEGAGIDDSRWLLPLRRQAAAIREAYEAGVMYENQQWIASMEPNE